MMGPYVEGLSKLIVKNFDDINTLIDEGELHFEIRTLYCALRGKGGGSLGFRSWKISLSIWLIEGVMVAI